MVTDLVSNLANLLTGGGNNNNNKIEEGFLNNFDFNQTCLLITLIFVIIFMYKKEIMKMLNLK